MKRRLGQLMGRDEWTLVFQDTFTDADNTLLGSHTPDLNSISASYYIDNAVSGAGSGSASILTNVLTNSVSTATRNSYVALNVGASRRRVKARIRSTNSFAVLGLNATAADFAGHSSVEAVVIPGSGALALRTKVVSTYTTLHTFTMTATANVWYAIDAVIDGAACDVTITKESTSETESASVNPAISTGNYVYTTLDNIDGNAAGLDDLEIYH